MDCQLRSHKLSGILVTSFAIVSLMIYVSMLQMNSVGKGATFKDHFRRLIWFGDRDLSGTTKNSSKSVSPLEAEFNVEKLQTTKLPESIKALPNLKLSSPDHNTEYSEAYDTISKNSTSSGADYDCKVPPGGFKSWTGGIVTKVTPEIHVNCTLLFKGYDEFEVKRIRLASHDWPAKEHAKRFAESVKTHTCSNFKDELEDNFYATKEELDFPLAFAMLIHNSPFQVYRLLKVIYRPHNIYCIHYDSRSSEDLKLLFNKLADCFDNIIISSVIREVDWGRHSLMDAQMTCFGDLLKRHHEYPWHYVITLCGKELPLRTNKEMVQLLWPLKGSSAIVSHPTPKWERERYEKRWTLDKSKSGLIPVDKNTSPIPYNLTMYKSLIYFALTPAFVNYTLNDEVAIALSRFLKDALIPEESFYGTLFMIPGVPGGYSADKRYLVPVVSTTIWMTGPAQNREPYKFCKSGYKVHGICILTSADLDKVESKVDVDNLKGPMFHNKYFMETDHTVMDCMEKELVSRNRLEHTKDCL